MSTIINQHYNTIMKNKKQHLIASLKTAINALKNDTIKYDWKYHSSCNCGVVSQAVLGISKYTLIEKVNNLGNGIPENEWTWKGAVQYHCDITGKTNNQILNDLFDAGLSATDVCHLEYLENPAILKRSGIYYNGPITKKVKTSVKTTIIKKGFWKSETLNEDIFEEQTTNVTDYLCPKYYSKKENLIKYLIAWVQILEEDEMQITPTSTVEELHEQLLKLVANDDSDSYLKAGELRDKIAITV